MAAKGSWIASAAEQNGLRGAPRLGAAGGNGEARRNIFERLENVLDRNAFLKARADDLAKLLFDVLADDKDELAEAGAKSVEDRVVDDGFAGGANGIDLLEAAIAAAHSGSKNKKCGRGCRGHESGLFVG